MTSLERVVASLAKLPGLGRKSASRVAYHLLRADPAFVRTLAADIVAVREKMRPCRQCGMYAETDTCGICADPSRDPSVVCVVEQSWDIETIEATREFRGRYHVLMGVLSPIDGIGPNDIRLGSLLERVRADGIKEVILATNPTVEGEATAALISAQVRELGVTATQLAHGLPMGSDLEYSDRLTVSRALRARVRLN